MFRSFFRQWIFKKKCFWDLMTLNCGSVSRVESQYKNFWQNLVATFCPLFTWIKGTKCGDQVLSKIFVLWFYSSNLNLLAVIDQKLSNLVFCAYLLHHTNFVLMALYYFYWDLKVALNSLNTKPLPPKRKRKQSW